MSNTSDYINRGKAIDAVHQRIKQIGYDGDPYVLSIRQAVRDVPAADVVEVVRCKECRYHDDEQAGMIYCPSMVGGWVDSDWFCKDGERKDDAE